MNSLRFRTLEQDFQVQKPLRQPQPGVNPASSILGDSMCLPLNDDTLYVKVCTSS